MKKRLPVKVLVLGATGLLGSNLVRALLARGDEVRALIRASNPASTLSGLAFERVNGDLNNAAAVARACRGVTVVYHAAGYYPPQTIPADAAVSVAMRQTRHMITALGNARPSIRKLVFVSSLTTIGPPHVPGSLADETCEFQTMYSDNPYLMAKQAMERAILDAAARGLPAVVVNPTCFYGPYDSKPTSGTQILMIAKRMMPAYVQGQTNVIDVRDVAVAMIKAADAGRVGERYIIGNWNTTHQEVNELIARVAGVMPPLARVPFSVARLGSKVGEWGFQTMLRRPAPVPSFFVEMLTHMQHYDCSKAVRELAYPRNPIEPAIQDALQWFRTNGYL
jgi:dihydroflavonol-4-reductase